MKNRNPRDRHYDNAERWLAGNDPAYRQRDWDTPSRDALTRCVDTTEEQQLELHGLDSAMPDDEPHEDS